MSMNKAPQGERIHIAIFGKRNAGKSSVINAITNQNISLVSDVLGTTTDPVYKAMELLPIGPVVIIDTAGIDDVGELGQLRIEKTKKVLNKTDVAVIVIDAISGFTNFEKSILRDIKSKKIPYVVVLNKIDQKQLTVEEIGSIEQQIDTKLVLISALNKQNIDQLKNAIIKVLPNEEEKFRIVGDLISPGDLVVLVTPIDKAAPKGRLILPQQQVIRDVLESDAICIVTKEYELKQTLESINKKPKLVITDSQAFAKVSADTPKDVPLTSFSILFARYKGDLSEMVDGAKAIESLKRGDKILIAEGCTHHRQADDIGTVKIPRWLRQYTGLKLDFDVTSGTKYPDNLEEYALVIHCGGCILNRKEMQHRIVAAKERNVKIVNYGVLIAYMQGILPRSIEAFNIDI